jgi:hypothetical protein
MATCNRCGEEIEFRYVDGRVVPVHPDGGWQCGSWGTAGGTPASTPASTPAARPPREWLDRKFTGRTICPECGEPVHFIRHNGGSVWLDDLGWPWPKHPCFDKPETATRRFSTWAPKAAVLRSRELGIIVGITSDPRFAEPRLQIRLTDGAAVSLILRWTPSDCSLLGALVMLSVEDSLLLHPEHGEMPFHSLARQVSPDAKQVPTTTDQRVSAAIGSVASKAWAAVAAVPDAEARLKEAKQEALRLIGMLSPHIKGQVLHQLSSEKWTQLRVRRP